MKKSLRDSLIDQGACLVGYADLQTLPREVRSDLPTAVSIAVALNPRIISGIISGPTLEYWDEYNRANARLETLAKYAVKLIETNGCQVKWLAPTIISTDPDTGTSVSYDPKTMSSLLPHKTAATLAGLGWIGKCALLITRKFGSAVRLTTILTDAPLPAGKPIETSRCGNCVRCVEACPGHAASGNLWAAGMPREAFFDASICRNTAFAQAARIGVKETICGRCIVSCRRTQEYLRRAGFPVLADKK